jgi:hypothetical protein
MPGSQGMKRRRKDYAVNKSAAALQAIVPQYEELLSVLKALRIVTLFL